MSSSKPMSDGGKGSVRRNEDTEAYRNNFDNIFRKKEVKPMIEEHDDHEDFDEDDEEHMCDWCNGTGEGQYDGSSCRKCHGTGMMPFDGGDDYDDSGY